MRTIGLHFVLTLVVLIAIELHSVCALVITDSKREILIANGVVRIQESLVVNNDAKGEVKEAILCQSTRLTEHLAFREVVQGSSADDFVELTYSSTTPSGVPANISCLVATLQPPLKAGQSTNVKQFSVHTHMLTPFPAKVLQKDPQLVLYEDYLYPISPYPIKTTEVQVKLPSTTVASYTKIDGTSDKSKDTLKYAAGEQKAFALQPLRVHVEHPHMFATVKSLVREVEVSHWGNVYVEEHYELAHTGAQLTGPWSRLDFQMNPMLYGRNAIQSLRMDLPAGARALYYRDEIGNISTSRVRYTRAKVDVSLEPRYPLFGGWKVKFTFGYSLPLSFVVAKTKGGRLQLSSPFGCALKDVVVDEMVIKVVLPEGVSNIRSHAPYSDVTVEQDTKFTYLDVNGRPVIVLTKHNLVPEHSAPLAITYSFSTLAMLREPLLLVAAFATLFGIAIVSSRLDLSISKDAKYKAKLEHEQLADSVQKLDGKLAERRRLLRELEVAAATKPVADCQALKTSAESTFKTTEADMKALLKELEGISSREADKFAKVVEDERSLVANALTLFTKKVDLVKAGAKAAEIEKKLAGSEKAVADASKAIKAAADKLFQAY